MADLAAGSAEREDAGLAGGLLVTKLFVPPLQAGFVPRPRLVARLGEGLERGLVLVCAPAGFGKTSLLADWARSGQRLIAWLSLDAGDNDPARFWRHVVTALDRVRPGLAGRLAPLFGPPAPLSFEGLVTALINEVAGQSGEAGVVLALDDYHLIDTDEVHRSVGFLLKHRPPDLRLVLASRSDPPLPLARSRAHGELAELRAAELRFTSAESAAVLQESAGPGSQVPADAVAAVANRTEGWVAGLQLAGLSLRGQRDMAGFVASFSGSHRYVLDFLAEEVLDRQPAELREFLLETSVLERLSGDLCDAVTGGTGSQRLLEQVERANLFLVPLDDVRNWWRYHHLFGDLLRARLQEERPHRVQELHYRAASWCEQQGLADEAIAHALAAGDPVWASRMIERHADSRLLLSEGATLQRWLAAVPPELVASRPRLSLARANLALLTGDVAAFEVPLAVAEAALAAAPEVADEPFEPSVGRAMSLLVNLPAMIALGRSHVAELRGDAGATAAFASQAQDLLAGGELQLEVLVRVHVATAEQLAGQLAAAERDFAWSIRRWREAGDRFMAMRSSTLLAQVQQAVGRLDAALETYRQALEVTAPRGGHPLPTAGAAHVGIAEVAYQRDELEAAREHATEGIALCRQLVGVMRGAAQPLATGLMTLAWIRLASGDPVAAGEAMAEAVTAAPEAGVTSLLNPVPAQRARFLLAQGDVAGAAGWAEERGLRPGDDPGYPREPEYLVLARVLLAEERVDEALGLLQRLYASALGQGRQGSAVEIQALRALALAAADRQTDALAALAEAIELGAPQGYVRVFADEGPPMKALLARIAEARRGEPGTIAGAPLRYLGRVIRAFESGAAAGERIPPRQGGGIPGLVEALTQRELEVLQLLSAGKSNREIAGELYVTIATVKKHVAHIFGKLGVANRTEAMARAHELDLLSDSGSPDPR
ncbi:MAG: hypothetical protein J2P30_01720 [Actinobacteria bacterium]|nr:hypothetical protein [Actinomycetota bacterium]